MAIGGLAGINCQCQWGLSGIFLGVVIILAAGVFTAIPALFGEPIALCWFWFGLGAALLLIGGLLEAVNFKSAKAREMYDEEDGSGELQAPNHYIMIA
eukprot:CAMPEP_0115082784 /NCGR_PEP_ID=MMETSP0227-20121206/20123_1 /TAXON_ID=89957 /ORGANISM="Polarella glacialis, Strain CCMP 1383" /LENGTH=97 /DNA_ID=CAMNT_0002470971 /DNA_START=59 /DNA_END=352 /DNA_ORIENTATION=+